MRHQPKGICRIELGFLELDQVDCVGAIGRVVLSFLRARARCIDRDLGPEDTNAAKMEFKLWR
jgi:hypothetical protein